MALLHIQTLGDLQMRTGTGAIVTISAKKSQALVAYLSVKPGQRVSRDKLALLLWSSTGPEQARQSLRQTLSTLRKELAALSQDATLAKVLIEENDLLGVEETLVDVDAASFESLVGAGTESALTEAIKLYRGDFLDGFYINEDRFDQWALGERDRLHRMALRAHIQLIDLQSRRSALDDAIVTAQQSLRLDGLQEPVHRALMRLYMQSGDLVNALQQYENCAKALKRELRIEPDSDTKALQREILQVRARTSAPGAPTGEREDRRRAVLVVEDNVLSRELTNALLKSAGYHAIVAKDGAEALMIIGREHVDLVLLDVDLPFIDGHSLLQAIRENGVEVPAIFVSGLAGDEVEVRAFEVGAADFIRKPVKNSVLLARVAKVLRDRE
jgi:DNA-binding SARP family transcriptional activator